MAFQGELIKVTDEDSSAVAMSIYSGIFNLGIGCGTALGGAVTTGVGVAGVGWVGAAVAAAALAFCVVRLLPLLEGRHAAR